MFCSTVELDSPVCSSDSGSLGVTAGANKIPPKCVVIESYRLDEGLVSHTGRTVRNIVLGEGEYRRVNS